jgi:hypothetical protein
MWWGHYGRGRRGPHVLRLLGLMFLARLFLGRRGPFGGGRFGYGGYGRRRGFGGPGGMAGPGGWGWW